MRSNRAGHFTSSLLLAGALAAGGHAAAQESASRAPATGTLQSALDSLLADPVLSRALVGVRIDVLADPGREVAPAILYARDNRKLVMPASNMKLVTLAADRLGWHFAYDTSLVAAGSIADGVLDGDLVVIGGGDPSIVGQSDGPAPLFADWASALSEAGIHRINGRLVGDDRLFDREGFGRGWSWDYLAASYAAPSGALSYNENAIAVRITPGPGVGQAAQIEATPAGHGLTLVDAVTTGPADSSARIDLNRPAGQSILTVSGSIPLGGLPLVRGAAVVDPTRFFLEGFRQALITRGLVIGDGVCSIGEAQPPPPAAPRRTIATRSSATLSALAGYFLKVSQNFYADMLLKTIGRAAGHAGSVSDGVQAVRETVGPWGVAPDEIVMNDGSGLSRYDYVTADAIVTVLRHVWQDETLRGPFVAALPVAGRDGTLGTRMRGTILDDRVEAKTGTLANVRSLSGYLETTSGKHVVFAILVNNFTAPASAIDAVVEKMLTLVAAQ